MTPEEVLQRIKLLAVAANGASGTALVTVYASSRDAEALRLTVAILERLDRSLWKKDEPCLPA